MWHHLNLNRPSSSAPVEDTSVLIFVPGDPTDAAAFRTVTLDAPPHIMQPHSAPMNPDFPELNEDSSYQDDLEIPSFFTSDNVGDATTGGPYRGGLYGRLNAQRRIIERHHIPPHSVSPLSSKHFGPAIQMDYADHRNLPSTGYSLTAIQYRAQLTRLIEQGNMLEAIQMEINTIRSHYGDKYDAAIEEMLQNLPKDWE